MVDNINVKDYTDINPRSKVVNRKQFTGSQISLLNRSMLYAGIGFVAIALIAFTLSVSLYKSYSLYTLGNAIGALWGISIVLIITSLILSMVVNTKLFTRNGNVSKGLIWTMWGIYILAEGLGFGILFLAFIVQFSLNSGVLYLTLIFAAGGAAFIIASFIGKSLSTKATVSLGRFVGMLSIAFLIMTFVFLITSLIASFVGSFNTDGLFLMIVGFSTILFLLYLVFDISSISKTQQFIGVDNASLNWTLGMIFGFRLLVDLVGLVWNVAILVLRFAR